MRWIAGSVAVVLLAGCGDSNDSDGGSIPPDAQALLDYEQAGVKLVIPRLSGFEARLPFLLQPGTPGAGGLVFQPDPSPGAPPNSYLFSIPVDGDDNGISEVTLDGSAAFNGDPANAGTGFGGHLDFTMSMTGGLGDFTGAMDFTLNASGERELSGTGTFTEGVTGNVSTLTVSPGSPMTMKAATGAADSRANACGYSLNGSADLQVTGAAGTLSSTWVFSNASRNVEVTNGSFESGSTTTPIPNTTLTIPCGNNGVLADWVGVFDQDWGCFPLEVGQATLTLSKTGNTIDISDEDPPGSGDLASYSAAPVPGNPHVLRGFFIGGPPGSTYREEFTWTLSPTGTGFSQISFYVYQEGPSIGSGGLCAGRAVKR
jgi:hypothetical protein